MPLILDKRSEEAWINPIEKEEISRLMTAFDGILMGSHTISKLITSRTQNSNVPQVKEEFKYLELESN